LIKAALRSVPRMSIVSALIVVGVVHSGASGPIAQVARILAAAADVVEGGSRGAVYGLDAASNLSSEVLVWSRDAVSTGKDLYHNMYSGIDLVNVSITKRRARIVAASASVFGRWARSPQAAALTQLPAEALDQLAATADTLSLWMPEVHLDNAVFSPAWEMATIQTEAAYLRSGHAEFRWDFTVVRYDVVWANPMWELLGFAPDAETELVGQAVKKVVAEVPVSETSGSELPTLELPVRTVIGATAERLGFAVCFFFAGPPPKGRAAPTQSHPDSESMAGTGTGRGKDEL